MKKFTWFLCRKINSYLHFLERLSKYNHNEDRNHLLRCPQWIQLTATKSEVMADSNFAPSQWETSLQSNAVSHWLGTNLESALWCWQENLFHITVTLWHHLAVLLLRCHGLLVELDGLVILPRLDGMLRHLGTDAEINNTIKISWSWKFSKCHDYEDYWKWEHLWELSYDNSVTRITDTLLKTSFFMLNSSRMKNVNTQKIFQRKWRHGFVSDDISTHFAASCFWAATASGCSTWTRFSTLQGFHQHWFIVD